MITCKACQYIYGDWRTNCPTCGKLPEIDSCRKSDNEYKSMASAHGCVRVKQELYTGRIFQQIVRN